jgi:hypothetical protein
MKRIALLLLLILTAVPLWADCPDCYFYGGDFAPVGPWSNGLANENDAIVGGNPYGAATYQNFVASTSIPVGGLFTNNLSQLSPSSAYWEIRSGVSEGNGGSLIASGTGSGSNFMQTPTGRHGFGFTEYQDEVTNLSVDLPAGTYWFAVVPQALNQAGRSFNSNTIGANRIGTEVENQQFFNSSFFGANFTNANNEGVFPSFSSGVLVNFVPEPSSFILLSSGFMGVAFAARRKWFN